MTNGVVQQYLDLSAKLAIEYGDSTIILMQVGSFYEMYGLRSLGGGPLLGSRIEDVAKGCDLLVANKAQRIIAPFTLDPVEHMVCMAGFGLPQLGKYVRRLQEMQYTVAIYEQQERVEPGFDRVLREIISPGTYVEADACATTNIVACVVLGASNGTVVSASVATFDMVTGDNRVEGFENTVEVGRSITDDVDRLMSCASPKEVLLVSLDLTVLALRKLTPTLGLSSTKHHLVGCDSDDTLKGQIRCAHKQVYQRDALVKCYTGLTGDAVAGWMRQVGSDLSSLVVLLDFVGKHNPALLLQLSTPEVGEKQGILRMANHSLSQLNILACGKGKLSSVTDMVDCTITPMGSRLVRERLWRPLSNAESISKRLSFVREWVESDSWELLRVGLEGIGDIMRLHRLSAVGKLKVSHLSKLDDYVVKAARLVELWGSERVDGRYPNLRQSLRDINAEVLATIEPVKCANIGEVTADKLLKVPAADVMFFKVGVCAVCDQAATQSKICRLELERERDICENVLYSAGEKKSKSKKFVAEIDRRTLCTVVEKEGPYISGTKRRLEMVVEERKDVALRVTTLPGSKSTYVLTSPHLNEMRRKAWDAHKDLVDSVLKRWKALVLQLGCLGCSMRAISDFVSETDAIQNTCYVAKKYCHVEPSIVEGAKSSVQLMGVRHPLVEAINRDEIYIANDVSLGLEEDVILLYGTNAVGKSSLIKSIGIAVCLAQAGMYVPCASMTLCPYESLYTRILGNDDLFRGLSTFAVEMSELRTVLLEGNQKSMVIGDELCSGTETSSATSIFAAAVDMLHARRCSSIFATHFHEIVDYAEITCLSRLSVRHMAVVYDESVGELVYDRRLRDGPGNNMYGLEVCKALSLPEELLEKAHKLRKAHCSSAASTFELKGSKYNSRRLRTACERCGQPRTEVHHLRHRAGAKDGRIGQTDLNHCANLVNVCEKCHLHFHSSGLQHRKVKTLTGHTAILPLE